MRAPQALASLLPAAALAATGGSARAFDQANPERAALAFRKLAYSMDDSLTFCWMHGTRYGVQGTITTQFWDMHVATWLTTRDLENGTHKVTSSGANFYTLPGQTTLLERFRNPYTGETVDIPYARPIARKSAFDVKGGGLFEARFPDVAKDPGALLRR